MRIMLNGTIGDGEPPSFRSRSSSRRQLTMPTLCVLFCLFGMGITVQTPVIGVLCRGCENGVASSNSSRASLQNLQNLVAMTNSTLVSLLQSSVSQALQSVTNIPVKLFPLKDNCVNTSSLYNITSCYDEIRQLVSDNVRHVLVYDLEDPTQGVSLAYVTSSRFAPPNNITFSFFRKAPTTSSSQLSALFTSITSLSNSEVVALPQPAMGVEAGILAGLVSTAQSIAVLTSPMWSSVSDGVREGVLQSCPLCYIKEVMLCSNNFMCPGETVKILAEVAPADVVVVATPAIRDLMTQGSAAGSTKRVIAVLLGTEPQIGDLIAGDNSTDPQFLGSVAVRGEDLLLGAYYALTATFSPRQRSARYSWSTNFSETSNISTDLSQVFHEFLFDQNTFRQGRVAVQYDPMTKARVDAELLGGAPFIPIGYTSTGALSSDETALPDVQSGTGCSFGDRPIYISPDLQFIFLFDIVGNSQMRLVTTLNVSLNEMNTLVDDYKTTELNAYYNATRFLNFSNPVVKAQIRRRRGMTCVAVSSFELLLIGGIYSDDVSNATAKEVLRLRSVCIPQSSNNHCDNIILENITSEVTASSNAGGDGAMGFPYQGKKLFVSDAWGVAFLMLVADGYARQPFAYSENVAMVQLKQPWRRVGTTQFGMPSYASQFAVYDPPMYIENSTRGYPLLVGFDIIHNVLVEMSWVNRNDIRQGGQWVLFGQQLSSSPPTNTISPFSRVLSLRQQESVVCVFYTDVAQRFTAVVADSVAFTTSLYQYSTSNQKWLLRRTVSVNFAMRFCEQLPAVGGGDAVLFPVASASQMPTWRHVLLIDFPQKLPSCGSLQVLAPSLRECEYCGSGEAKMPDGFCGPMPLPQSVVNVNLIVGLTVGCTALSAAIAVALICAYRLHKGKARMKQAAAMEARNAEYAPQSGPMSILVIQISDVDMWSLDNKRRSLSTTTAAQDTTPKSHSVSGDAGSNDERIHLHQVIDHFSEVLYRSTAANRCYLSQFRGDHAVVVSNGAIDLLCVAVEIAYSMSSMEPPIRVSCGLHNSQIQRSEDTQLRRYFFAGEGLRVTARIAAISRKGAIMVSEEYLGNVEDSAVKHLGMVRGHTHMLKVDNSPFTVRELLLHAVMEQFEGESGTDTRDRRKTVLQKKRMHGSTSNTSLVNPRLSSNELPHLALANGSSTGGGGDGGLVSATGILGHTQIPSPRSGSQPTRFAAPLQESSEANTDLGAAPAGSIGSGAPHISRGMNANAFAVLDQNQSHSHSQEKLSPSSSMRGGALIGSESFTGATAILGGSSQEVSDTMPASRNPFTVRRKSSKTPHSNGSQTLPPQSQPNSSPRPPTSGISTRSGGLSSGALSSLNLQNVGNLEESIQLSGSLRGQVVSDDTPPHISAGGGANVVTPGVASVLQSFTVAKHNPLAGAAPLPIENTVNPDEPSVSAVHTNSNLSHSSAQLAQRSVKPLGQQEMDVLVTFATSLARVLLTHFSTTSKGTYPFELLVQRLHLPIQLKGKHMSSLISSNALRVFALRMIAMAPSLVTDVRELSDTGAQTSSSSNDANGSSLIRHVSGTNASFRLPAMAGIPEHSADLSHLQHGGALPNIPLVAATENSNSRLPLVADSNGSSSALKLMSTEGAAPSSIPTAGGAIGTSASFALLPDTSETPPGSLLRPQCDAVTSSSTTASSSRGIVFPQEGYQQQQQQQQQQQHASPLSTQPSQSGLFFELSGTAGPSPPAAPPSVSARLRQSNEEPQPLETMALPLEEEEVRNDVVPPMPQGASVGPPSLTGFPTILSSAQNPSAVAPREPAGESGTFTDGSTATSQSREAVSGHTFDFQVSPNTHTAAFRTGSGHTVGDESASSSGLPLPHLTPTGAQPTIPLGQSTSSKRSSSNDDTHSATMPYNSEVQTNPRDSPFSDMLPLPLGAANTLPGNNSASSSHGAFSDSGGAFPVHLVKKRRKSKPSSTVKRPSITDEETAENSVTISSPDDSVPMVNVAQQQQQLQMTREGAGVASNNAPSSAVLAALSIGSSGTFDGGNPAMSPSAALFSSSNIPPGSAGAATATPSLREAPMSEGSRTVDDEDESSSPCEVSVKRPFEQSDMVF